MSKARLAGFAVLTGLICLSQGVSGVMDLLQHESIALPMAELGYPLYVMTILGVWKLLGAVALAVPKLPRVKEWAYAGFFFDFTGAAASHGFNGDGVAGVAPPLVLLAILVGSYALRPEGRRLAGSAL